MMYHQPMSTRHRRAYERDRDRFAGRRPTHDVHVMYFTAWVNGDPNSIEAELVHWEKREHRAEAHRSRAEKHRAKL